MSNRKEQKERKELRFSNIGTNHQIGELSWKWKKSREIGK